MPAVRLVKRLRCRIRTVWETGTMAAFWRSLIRPPLVVASGHLHPVVTAWSETRVSPDHEAWPGLVQFDESRCVDCGELTDPTAWRPYYGRPR